MFTATIRDFDSGDVLGAIIAREKIFSTGSCGYYGQDKVEIAGKRYQVQLQMVEIGSKPDVKSQ